MWPILARKRDWHLRCHDCHYHWCPGAGHILHTHFSDSQGDSLFTLLILYINWKYIVLIIITHSYIQVEVFWVVMWYSVVVGYQPFGGSCCLTLRMEGTRSFRMLVPYHNTTCHHNPEDLNLNFHHHVNLKSHIIFWCFHQEGHLW